MTRLFIIFYILITITAPLLALAVETGLIPCGFDNNKNGKIDKEEMCALKNFGCLAENVINFLLFRLAAPLAVISFLIGGILMITAAGNQNQLERGKSIFYNTVIGIVLAFGAWLIVDLILQSLLNPKNLENPLRTIKTCRVYIEV